MIEISVVKDFSDKPFGRYRTDGKWSGERFREEVLLPAFRSNIDNQLVQVDLRDVPRGYGSSFLEEAFGGLVRAGIEKSKLKSLLVVLTDEEDYLLEINEYIDRA